MSKERHRKFEELLRMVSALIYDKKPFQPTHMFRSEHRKRNKKGPEKVEVKGIVTSPVDGEKILVFKEEIGGGYCPEIEFYASAVPLGEWKMPEQSYLYESEDGQVAMIL
jgi:hypothetical protein